MEFIKEAEFWVAVAFVIFLAIMLYVGVHTTVTSSLDKRRSRIQSELEEAAKLKSEAQALLAEYKQKTANAEKEAAAIIEAAKADAERLAAEAHAKLEDFDAAIRWYATASTIRPDRTDLLAARGDLEERLLRFDDAVATFTKVYDLSF